MKRMLIYSIILISAIHLYSDTDEMSWLSRRFHLDDPVIEMTPLFINGEEIFIAYKKVSELGQDLIGQFDRAVLYSKKGSVRDYLFFNGRTVINSNGNEILNIRIGEESWLWEISPTMVNEKAFIYLSPIIDGSYPDSITITYNKEYEQFVISPLPWSYGIRLSNNESKLVSWARAGMPEENTDDYDFFTADIARLPKDQMRLLRNTIFALHGYQFKSKELQSHFDQFDWYFPRTGGNSKVQLPEKQQALVDFLLLQEDN